MMTRRKKARAVESRVRRANCEGLTPGRLGRGMEEEEFPNSIVSCAIMPSRLAFKYQCSFRQLRESRSRRWQQRTQMSERRRKKSRIGELSGARISPHHGGLELWFLTVEVGSLVAAALCRVSGLRLKWLLAGQASCPREAAAMEKGRMGALGRCSRLATSALQEY